MRWSPAYLSATIGPEETRTPCRECLPSSMPTLDGRPVMLAVQEGKFRQGTYHPACPDCPVIVYRRIRVPETVRDRDRRRFLVR
jgi:hypothetical protein